MTEYYGIAILFRALKSCAAVDLRFEVPRSMHSVLPFFKLIAMSLQWYVAIEARPSFKLRSISSIDLDSRLQTMALSILLYHQQTVRHYYD